MEQVTGPTLYRAPYVVPVVTRPIADGGVLVAEGRIVAVDQFRRLRAEAARVVELGGRILTPALINCHCHLELSYLADLGRGGSMAQGDITAWIRVLLARRAEAVALEVIARAYQEGVAAQYRQGVALVADIGNQRSSLSLAMGSGREPECLSFLELLGMTEQAAEAALASTGDDDDLCCTAHAPYSCHPRLIQGLKERARQAGGLFPIHVAESTDEIEFLATGQGPFREFLGERLRLLGVLAPREELTGLFSPPGCGSVEYLDSLGVLDSRTILVHAVHLTEAEALVIHRTGAQVCLCPKSNRTLGVGKAPVPMLTKAGILPGLGTDSLASNDALDLWQEMRVLQEDHPGLAPELIFRMATRGGAETLGVTHRLGSLAPGLTAKVLAIPFTGTEKEIYPFLVNGAEAITVEWPEGSGA